MYLMEVLHELLRADVSTFNNNMHIHINMYELCNKATQCQISAERINLALTRRLEAAKHCRTLL